MADHELEQGLVKLRSLVNQYEQELFQLRYFTTRDAVKALNRSNEEPDHELGDGITQRFAKHLAKHNQLVAAEAQFNKDYERIDVLEEQIRKCRVILGQMEQCVESNK